MSAGARTAKRGAHRGAHSGPARGLGRLGFIAKGLLYGVVAIIALDVALGDRKKAQPEEGAIAAISEQPFGEVLLVLLAIGLAGYVLWRLKIAIWGPPGESGPHATAERIGSVALAVTYAGLFIYTVRFLTTDHAHSETEPDSVTKSLLDEPYGVALVIAIGAVLIGVGAYEAYRSASHKFMEQLELERMNEHEERVATVAGTAGHAALAVVSSMIGAFLIKAAVEHDPKEAIGLDGALQELASQSLGPVILGIVAVGLLVYGGYCAFFESRYRKV